MKKAKPAKATKTENRSKSKKRGDLPTLEAATKIRGGRSRLAANHVELALVR